jgi:hypothetical protein
MAVWLAGCWLAGAVIERSQLANSRGNTIGLIDRLHGTKRGAMLWHRGPWVGRPTAGPRVTNPRVHAMLAFLK